MKVLNCFRAAAALVWTIASALLLQGCDAATDMEDRSDIRVGLISTLEGPFEAMGRDGVRGAEIALAEHNSMAGGRNLTLLKASSTGQPATAVAAAKKLVEVDKVHLMVGPLAGGEGLALKAYAKTQRGVTFLNGTSAAQEMTLVDPIPNLFRFSTDGAQWTAGLGRAAHARGHQKVVTVAEDYGFPHAQVRGFMLEFCSAGGTVEAKHWVPIGTSDFSQLIASIPLDVDAVFVALGGSHAVNFLKQYSAAGRKTPLIAGTSTLDQAVLTQAGVEPEKLLRTLSSGPVASSWISPAWTRFAQTYKTRYPDGFDSPSLAAYTYYVNMKAALLGIDKVQGRLGPDHKALRSALSSLSMETPTGPVHLDENRSAVANIFVTELAKRQDGTVHRKVLTVRPAVDQDMGFPKGTFVKAGWSRPDNFPCSSLVSR